MPPTADVDAGVQLGALVAESFQGGIDRQLQIRPACLRPYSARSSLRTLPAYSLPLMPSGTRMYSSSSSAPWRYALSSSASSGLTSLPHFCVVSALYMGSLARHDLKQKLSIYLSIISLMDMKAVAGGKSK